jgi:hypothetical protein
MTHSPKSSEYLRRTWVGMGVDTYAERGTEWASIPTQNVGRNGRRYLRRTGNGMGVDTYAERGTTWASIPTKNVERNGRRFSQHKKYQIIIILLPVCKLEVFTAVTMKNAVFWDIKKFIRHRRHITSPLQSPVG